MITGDHKYICSRLTRTADGLNMPKSIKFLVKLYVVTCIFISAVLFSLELSFTCKHTHSINMPLHCGILSLNRTRDVSNSTRVFQSKNIFDIISSNRTHDVSNDAGVFQSKNLSEIRLTPPRKITMEDVMSQRKSRVDAICDKKHPKDNYLRYTPPRSHFIVVDQKYKVVYCMVPKIASTSWTKMFLAQHERKTYDKISWKYWLSHWRTHMKDLNIFSKVQRKTILTTYKKFLFIRDPLDRIRSAFNNKFTRAGMSNEPELKAYGQRYGKRIIQRFRKNPDKQSSRTGLGVKFPEFIQYITSNGLYKADEHWNSIYNLCQPCHIRYDYIGNFYNVVEESKFVMDHIGLKNITYPSENILQVKKSSQSANVNMIKKFYESIPQAQKHLLWDMYKNDNELYGDLFNFIKL
ncbi:unnamed protein product [Owenia fusiformis]|uniref:Carbohydrate sulfotransferase n=1 Tax=Owenia fusiformis TaxID=6347 RepID=A0A8S4Q1R4_OWEFU|nr:unnamed protein product [Owenia fusiformis]